MHIERGERPLNGRFVMKIGVLGMQGDIEEHLSMLEKIGIPSIRVKSLKHLNSIDGLIIPGGESTTMVKLLKKTGLFDELIKRIKNGMPVYGTCAGMILLANKIVSHPEQESLKVLDIAVSRNGYGRQVDSFEVELSIPILGEMPFKAIFIRAPRITEVGREVEVLATYEETPVMVRSGNIFASSFHPEISNDTRIHELFAKVVRDAVNS
jgi:5'-phosphate synthase pdxT subunit